MSVAVPKFTALLVSLLAVLGVTLRADNGQAQSAYVSCTDRNSSGVALFENPCIAASGRIGCGEKISVIDREGPWLKIETADGRHTYVGATQVSRDKERFVAVIAPSAKAFDPSSCFSPRVRSDLPGKVPPHAIYTPDPDYDPEARRAHIQGTVLLSLTVGPDGLVRDAKIQKSLNSKLDQKALEAVRKWKFDPGLQDGKPIPADITVTVSFRLLH
jgi:TonB family protein